MNASLSRSTFFPVHDRQVIDARELVDIRSHEYQTTLQGLRGKVTILMIAHRIPANFRSDRIIRLVDGQVSE